MEKEQRRLSVFQLLKKKGQQAYKPAKQRLTELTSILTNKIQGFNNSTEPTAKEIDATTAQENDKGLGTSDSRNDLDQYFKRQSQTFSENQRLSYQSDNRFSLISNETDRFTTIQNEVKRLSITQNKVNRLRTIQTEANEVAKEKDHLRQCLDILQLTKHPKLEISIVKSQFQSILNSQQLKIYEFLPSQKIQQKKRVISKVLIAYFHVCNHIFKATYSQIQVKLVEGIFNGNLTQVKKLLASNPSLIDFKMKETGYNLLYVASMSPHVDIVEYFATKTQCWDIKTARSLPLNVAAWCGHFKVVQLLIDYGMSPRARSNGLNTTAAEETDQTEIVRLLNGNGVNSYRLNKILAEPLKENQKKIIKFIIEGKKSIDDMKKMIQKDQILLNFRSQYNNYSLLSIAIMSSNESAIQFILKTGCYFDITTCHTNPMQIAVESDNPKIVGLLLEYGLPFNVPDRFGYLPIQLIKLEQNDKSRQKYDSTKGSLQNDKPKTLAEKRQQIHDLLKKADEDKVNKLIAQLIEKGQLIGVINIFDDQQNARNLIARKLLTKNYLKKFDKHQNAFHGTPYDNLVDIVVQGLKEPGTKIGDKQTKSQSDNIQTGVEFNGIKDWNIAIFTTPSIYYACYYDKEGKSSKDLIANDIINWKAVLQVKIENKTFTKWEQTTNKQYKLTNNEPVLIEYRTKTKEGENEKVVVVAVIFLDGKYYERRHEKSQKVKTYSYSQITELMLNGNDEKVVQMYLEAQKQRILNGQKGQAK